MEVNLVLLSLGLMGGASLVVRSVFVRTLGWLTGLSCGLLVLAIAGVGYLVVPDAAGYASFGGWVLLAIAPALVAFGAQKAVDRRDFAAAARYSAVVYWVHPSAATRLSRIHCQAEAEVQAGRVDRAHDVLARAAQGGGVIAIWAHAADLRMRGAWSELADYLAKALTDEVATRLPLLIEMYLRALGEAGRRKDLFRAFGRLARFIDGDTLSRHRANAWLIVLAFGGRSATVERLLAARLESFKPPVQTFWRATALLAAGNEAAAGPLFSEVARSKDGFLARAAERRIAEGALFYSTALEAADHQICDAIALELDQERRYAFESQGRGRPIATLSLLGLNTAAFAVELATGDPMSDVDLIRIGALKPSLVYEAQEWWRGITCLFLHAGVLHLAMNMVGLMVIGPLVEFTFGRARWLMVYFASGIAGSVVLTLMTALGHAEDDPCVGASGCIMGLVGATLAISLVGLVKERARVARRRFIVIGSIVLLQTAFDLNVPQISFTAHASGLVVGFGLSLVFALRAHGRRIASGDAPIGL